MSGLIIKSKCNDIVKALKKAYPQARIALKFSSPLELLVATVLSAQCTDKRVNIVTEIIFKKYQTVNDYAQANLKEFEKDIRSVGFFRNKAKHIIAAAQIIAVCYKGNIPDTMKELISLPGIARKTANIILFNVFGKQEGIAVDTHVRRLSLRLGLTPHSDPVKIEKDLMLLVRKADWGILNYLLIEHGRAVCIARNPRCSCCSLIKLCDYYRGLT
ncbi:MAG: endonuclease III [Candidatus Omnitrophota bacterium]